MRWGRLIQREAIPLLAQVALWAMVGAVLGARMLALLVTANLCANAARGVSAAITARPIRLRRIAGGEALRVAVRRGWAIEAASMIVGLVVLAGIAVFYRGFGADRLVPLLAILAWGLPPRCNGPIRARGTALWWSRVLRSWLGVAGVALALACRPSIYTVVAALAVREWLTTLALALLPTSPPGARSLAQQRSDLPGWGEFVRATAEGATRRFVYHAGRSTLHAFLGPFGTIVARMSRGFGLHRSAGERPLLRRSIPVVGLGLLAASVAIIKLVPGPGALLISALLLRIGLLATGAALWNRLAPAEPASAKDDIDDD